MKNPSQEIRNQYQNYDWSGFPPASDGGFVEATVFSACDDASQSAFHMGGTAEAEGKVDQTRTCFMTGRIYLLTNVPSIP